MKTSLLSFFILFSVELNSQSIQENKLQAAILYNIVKYIEWPISDSNDFEIFILGNDEVFDALKANYEGKLIKNRKCSVKKVSSPSEASPNSVLYIGRGKSRDFELAKTLAGNRSWLTITENEAWGKKGSCVNFVVIDGKLKFELNRSALTTSNLKASGALTSMAIII